MGVVLCKDLLSYMSLPDNTTVSQLSSVNTVNDTFRPQMKENWNKLTVMDFLEPTYYIPETMSCWVALQVKCDLVVGIYTISYIQSYQLFVLTTLIRRTIF